jgi:signal peptidase I
MRHAEASDVSRQGVARRPQLTRLLLTMLKGGFVAVGVALLAAVAIGTFVFHMRMSPVLTGSMEPTYSPGDAVITKQVDVHSLRPGDIAVFVPPGESGSFAHRVTTVGTIDGHVVVTTRGDANAAPDPWRATLNQNTVPKVVAVLPVVGRPMTWVHTAWLHAAAIAALGLLLTAFGTRALLRTPRKEALT